MLTFISIRMVVKIHAENGIEIIMKIKQKYNCAQIKESNINKVTLQNNDCSELTKISSQRKSDKQKKR